jgi:integrase/recombinase XerD
MTGHPTGAPALRTLIADYLATRRALGFTLQGAGQVLLAFADHLDRSRAGEAQRDGTATREGTATGEHVTVEQALRFATAKPDASARSQALRLSAVRLFARWAQLLDSRIEVPPARLLPARATRPTPFIYTEAQVGALLAAAAELRPPIRAVTFVTLLALQSATGIRTGEALGLDVGDVDLGAGSRQATLTVTGKYGKTRLLPLHPTVATGLAGYLTTRAAVLPAANCPALLINTHGRRLGKGSVHPTFRAVADRAGLTAASTASRPRLHDLRHTFAVNTMLEAYRSGADPAATLPLLTTWLGHAEPSDTYWYLTGTAELMAAATERLERTRADSRTDSADEVRAARGADRS